MALGTLALKASSLVLPGGSILMTAGIGAALAPMLAERGATIGLVARRRERLEEVLSSCRRHAPKSRLWVADLADVARAEAVAREAWDAFGGLDVLVNNAAMGKRKRVPDLTPAEIDRVMTLNFTSPMRMGLAVLPGMLARGRGNLDEAQFRQRRTLRVGLCGRHRQQRGRESGGARPPDAGEFRAVQIHLKPPRRCVQRHGRYRPLRRAASAAREAAECRRDTFAAPRPPNALASRGRRRYS